MAAPEFDVPELKEFRTIPRLAPDVMAHSKPHVASEKINEAIGFPGELVENWQE